MLADYQQTTQRPALHRDSTRSGVLSQRIVALKSGKAGPSPQTARHAAEGHIAIPSIGPFVSGSDGNLQEVGPYPCSYLYCVPFLISRQASLYTLKPTLTCANPVLVTLHASKTHIGVLNHQNLSKASEHS